MSAEPVGPVHPADGPLAEFLRLRALESTASVQALEDAEDTAAAQD